MSYEVISEKDIQKLALMTRILIENDALKLFCKYSYDSYKRTFVEYHGSSDKIIRYIVDRGISGAFSWGGTNEGYNFWDRIHSEIWEIDR